MTPNLPQPPNTRIRLKNDPGRIGTTTPKIRKTSRGRKYLIYFNDGISGYQPEYELGSVKTIQETWDSLLGRQRFRRIFDMKRRNFS